MTKEKDFEKFMKALKEACKKMTDMHYFQLPVAGLKKNRYSEKECIVMNYTTSFEMFWEMTSVINWMVKLINLVIPYFLLN